MVLPIYIYGYPLLKKISEPISEGFDGLSELIDNMWETMYNASGVGLAAPQIGQSIRLFLVDTIQMMKEDEKDQGIKQVFINPVMLEESGDHWDYEEGCLSIPNIRGDVSRRNKIHISFLDGKFVEHTQVFDGLNARVIQHEYDHLEGKLFTEKLKPIKKRSIEKKLLKMKKGDFKCDYKHKVFQK